MWLLISFSFEIMAIEQVKISPFKLLVTLKYNISSLQAFRISLNETLKKQQ